VCFVLLQPHLREKQAATLNLTDCALDESVPESLLIDRIIGNCIQTYTNTPKNFDQRLRKLRLENPD
jgi:hypothetical protein